MDAMLINLKKKNLTDSLNSLILAGLTGSASAKSGARG
jgi:hypothetical protein